MIESKYLLQDSVEEVTNSFVIGSSVVPAPAFIPEIKGKEDLQVLLKHSEALPENNPVMVPANRWATDIESPLFRKGDLLKGIPPVEEFLKQHPFLFYDPPELFKYTLGKNLSTYALGGSLGKARKFKSHLKKGDVEEALDLIDPFFHAFIEKQLPTICSDLNIDTITVPGVKTGDIGKAWFDERVNEAYGAYISKIAGDASKCLNASIVPPVPLLSKSSGNATVQRVLGSNAVASLTCMSLSESEDKPLVPYFHLYLDWGLIELGDGVNINVILDLLQEGLSKWSFSGVAVTINGYESASKNGKIRQLGILVNEIVNVSHENHLPVILPRSKWYGLYYSDYNTQAFGSLLNGNLAYSRGGGSGSYENTFGKVPLIDKCVELKVNEVRKHIKEFGEFPFVNGLPRKPSADDYHNATTYRLNWGKAMRLMHVEEARRVRQGRSKGQLDAAQLYLERSSNHELNGL